MTNLVEVRGRFAALQCEKCGKWGWARLSKLEGTNWRNEFISYWMGTNTDGWVIRAYPEGKVRVVCSNCKPHLSEIRWGGGGIEHLAWELGKAFTSGTPIPKALDTYLDKCRTLEGIPADDSTLWLLLDYLPEPYDDNDALEDWLRSADMSYQTKQDELLADMARCEVVESIYWGNAAEGVVTTTGIRVPEAEFEKRLERLREIQERGFHPE